MLTKNLRTIREAVLLSQRELCEKLGFNRNNYAAYEQGRVTPPEDFWDVYERAFGVDRLHMQKKNLSQADVDNAINHWTEYRKNTTLHVKQPEPTSEISPDEMQTLLKIIDEQQKLIRYYQKKIQDKK